MPRLTGKANIPRLAVAIRKLVTAASDRLGSDCYIHAALGQAILARLGVEAKLVAGWAAWRTADGDSDIILHAPTPGMVPQPDALPFHVWLEVGDNILDLTTWSLRIKAAQLDALDGGHTTVAWCPDYLFVPKKTISPLGDVIQLGAGLYYYNHEPLVEARVIAEAQELDQADLETAWLIYQNPDLLVFGPNDVMKRGET